MPLFKKAESKSDFKEDSSKKKKDRRRKNNITKSTKKESNKSRWNTKSKKS